MNFDRIRYTIFNPREKSSWDMLDDNIKENVIKHFKTEHKNGYTFEFNDNEYYINNIPYTQNEFLEKKRKITSL